MAYHVYVNRVREGYREVRSGERTVRPYNTNNSYSHRIWQWEAAGGYIGFSDAEGTIGPDQNHRNELYNRFASKAKGDTSQLLTAAAEWNSSLNMIAKRAIQLRSAFNAVRKGNISAALDYLSVSEKDRTDKNNRRWRQSYRTQRPTEAWLEYWMGWAPLYGDIYNAIDNIQKPTPDQKITVGVTRSYQQRSEIKPWLPPIGKQVDVRRESITLAAYGRARVTNHNLFLANQLGLVNPAQTAWELVPFSFVADWVLNVGQVLGSLTDFAGLSITHAGTAEMRTTNFQRLLVTADPLFPGQYRPLYISRTAVGRQKSRSPGIVSKPELTLRLPKMSLSRAATSISLLTEIFSFSKRF